MSFDTPSDPDEELPDWLQNLQGDSDSGEDLLGSFQAAEEDEEAPDWLSGIAPEEEPQEEELIPTRQPLEPRAPEPAVEAPGDEEAAMGEEEGTPEWLQSIREKEGTGGLPAEEAPAEEPNDDSGWLHAMRAEHIQDTESLSFPQAEGESEDGGDYMERVRELKAEDEESGEAMPDWLSGYEDEAQSAPDWETQDTSKGETPDWLSGITGPQESVSQEEAAAAWLGGPSAVPRDQEEGSEASGLEWLGEVSGEGQETSEGDLDWLSSSGGAAAESFSEETPDWLSDSGGSQQSAFGGEALDFSEDTGAAAASVDAEFPGLPGEPAEAAPSWLADLEGTAPPPPGGMDTIPIKDLPHESAFTEEPGAEDTFTIEPADLPDWLGADAPAETPAPEASEEPAIARAQLPSWLQAMRPVEAVAPDQAPEEEEPRGQETVGPLAGLNNVLPAEPEVVHFGGRPPEQISGLTVTEAQHQYVQLLENMIREEEEAQPITRRTVALPQQIFRWVIAAVLYLAVLWPTFFGSTSVAMPAFVPEETGAVRDLISALPPSAPVLVAFEYQPGLSGEMEAASAAVLDHLLIQSAELIFVSTQPTGPGLVENHLNATNLRNDHTYLAVDPNTGNKQYVNLGFISGGPAALLNFATDPRETIPMPLEGDASAWDLPPLNALVDAQGQVDIRKFAMILVITDDPDIGRSWVEQVQPQLVDPNNPAQSVPLVMVLSAQAEPMLYPYYENSPRQINGIVTGLAGGAVYETFIRSRVARQYWDAFSWGLTVTVLILIFGGLVNLVRSWLASRQTPEKRGTA